jgi:hypothetical protein
MTAYAAYGTVTGSSGQVSVELFVAPGTYEIRVPSIHLDYDVFQANSAVVSATVGYYTGGMSGGSTVPVATMRQGAPATTATAKTGATGSGTQFIIGTFGAGTTVPPTPPLTDYALDDGSFIFEPPFDWILSPGTAVFVNISSFGSTTLDVVIFYEELRLSWHY